MAELISPEALNELPKLDKNKHLKACLACGLLKKPLDVLNYMSNDEFVFVFGSFTRSDVRIALF